MTTDDLRHRAIVAIDMERSTFQTNPVKAHLRRVMYDLFADALGAAGITARHRDPFVDRGDGILALLHPTQRVPKTMLLTTVVPQLTARLREHNHRTVEDRLRLRAVIHAGEVHYDRRGCFGESLDIAFRLLDAPRVKSELQQAPTPLALVVSGAIYWSIVRHGYDGVDERDYRRTVHVRIAGRTHYGWLLQSNGVEDNIT